MMKKAVAAMSVICALLYVGSVAYFYQFPQFFNVVEDNSRVEGAAYADTLARITEEMNANWMPNDIFFWPTNLMDNPQNFQLGELEAVRYATRILRDQLSRMRTTDAIDPDCEAVFIAYSNSPFYVLWPRTETKYGEGVDALKRYRDRLIESEARFFARADNQKEFFAQFASLLGGASQRLANAPRDRITRLTEETAGDVTLGGEHRIEHQTPWTQIDDNFYYAQGELYVLRELTRAIQRDFSVIIKQRKADELVEAIIEILDSSQFKPWVVTNGEVGSLLANHSLQLQARLEDARQKIASLENILQ